MKKYTLETTVFDDGSLTTSLKHGNDEVHASVSRLSDHEMNLTFAANGQDDQHQLLEGDFGPTVQRVFNDVFKLYGRTVARHYEHDFKGKFGPHCPWCGKQHTNEHATAEIAAEETVVGAD